MNMVKLIPAVCPQCGAKLQVSDGLKKFCCTYCGTEIIVDRELKTEVVISCPDCEGTGKCKPHRDDYGVTVYTCYGTGKCPGCAGTGKIGQQPCALCNGSGKCWSCNGTGKCARCQGTGRVTT